MTLKSSLLATALMTFGSVAHAQETSMTEVSDGVFHFFAMGYSSMVAIGDNGVLVTDPSFTSRAEVLKAELAKISDKSVTHIALSHEHFDHVGGTEVFGGAEIILQENGTDVLKLSPLLPMPKVTTTFDETLTIELGNKSVELHHLAVADGVATTVARVPDDNVVFSVDM
jgi:glyoxylase-like metal-dependent hydrolase (beta-lactamase superfamily II)